MMDNKANPDRLSVGEHLGELRGRFIRCLAAVLLTSCGMMVFTDIVLDVFIRPIGFIVFTSPADAFVARLGLTVFMGFVVTLPYILYQIWNFAASALKPEEKKYAVIFGPFSFLVFILGGMFAFFVVIPIALKFLLGFAGGNMQPMITVKNYISFVLTMILAFAVVFELPLVIAFLTKIGIATPEFLIQKRKYAFMGIMILSAIVTPPDFITQLIMAGPLMILYEAGIILSRFVEKERRV